MSFNFYKFLISGAFCLMKVIFVILAFSGGFLGVSDSKESVCNAEDLGLIHVSGRPTGEGNGNPIQYSCLENATDGGIWRATVHAITESDTTERLSLYVLRGFRAVSG